MPATHEPDRPLFGHPPDGDERRRTESAVAESESRFRAWLNAAPTMIWASGPEGDNSWVNQRWLDFTGRTREDERRDWAGAFHPDDREAAVAAAGTAFAARSAFRSEFRVRHADASFRRILNEGAPHFGADGTFLGFIGTCTDITERVLAEEALRESEAQQRIGEDQLRAIYTASPLGIVQADVDHRIIDANPAFLRIVGYAREELLGRSLPGCFVHPEDAASAARAAAALRLDATGSAHFETRWLRKDGACISVALDVQPSGPETRGPRFYFGMVEDITARKRIEDELRRVAREQEILLESANAGIVMVVDRKQVWVNRRMEEMFGYTRAEMVGQSTRMYYPSHEAFEAVGKAVPNSARGLTLEADVELRHRDGRAIWTRYNGRLVDPADASKGILWIVTDQTAQRAASEALRQSEARFRNLFEAHGAVMMLIDPGSGAIVDVNPAGALLYGYERAALRSMQMSKLNVRPPVELKRSLQSAAAGQNTLITQHRRADGSIFTAEINASPMEVGGRRLLFGIIQDVTQRERALEALERERRWCRSLLAIAQDGIHVLDKEGNLIEANAAFLRMLGQGPDAVGRLNLRDWAPGVPAAKLADMLRTQLEGPQSFEGQILRLDGAIIEAEINAGPVELEGRRYVLACSRDITARKEFEHQLALKKAEVEALNLSLEDRLRRSVAELRSKDQLLITQSRHAAMGEMIGNIAHQWRQPLSALGMILANLRDDARHGELDAAAVERAVADGNQLVQKMSTTINDFRDFFQPMKEKSAFPALAVVRETLALLEGSLRHAGITVEVDAATDLSLFGFSNEYSQVLLNLLTNSRQAIQDAKVGHGRVVLRLSERDGLGCLAVRDNGGGIPAPVIDRIFEPYFSTKPGGTGIGLYMSREIIERSMGGRVEARNVDGGAEFTVLTPLAGPAGAGADAPRSPKSL